MNIQAIRVIYLSEVRRSIKSSFQSFAGPILSTSLYFIVFGAALGNRMTKINHINYGAFIIPGLIMMTLLSACLMGSSFSIFIKKLDGSIYELFSAPISSIEILIGFVGASVTKSMILCSLTLLTARIFVDFEIMHPVFMLAFLLIVSIGFNLLGFILGLLVSTIDQLQIFPTLIIAPLAFLGGTFYSTSMLPPFWRQITILNPILYLVGGLRWSFYEVSDVSLAMSLLVSSGFLFVCFIAIVVIFRTGYKIRN